MNYVNIEKASCVDFSGWSVVLQVSGCEHKCEGCFVKNAGWWKYTSGEPFTEDIEKKLLSYISKPYIDNLVLQGGDPLFKNNLTAILQLCKNVKTSLPSKKIVLFTGFTLDHLLEDKNRSNILQYVDYLVDGRFEKELTNPDLLFRGSSNQKIWKNNNGSWSDMTSYFTRSVIC